VGENKRYESDMNGLIIVILCVIVEEQSFPSITNHMLSKPPAGLKPARWYGVEFAGCCESLLYFVCLYRYYFLFCFAFLLAKPARKKLNQDSKIAGDYHVNDSTTLRLSIRPVRPVRSRRVSPRAIRSSISLASMITLLPKILSASTAPSRRCERRFHLGP
jgi:hypothetical protein